MEHAHRPLKRWQVWGLWVVVSALGYGVGASALYLSAIPLTFRRLVFLSVRGVAEWLFLKRVTTASAAWIPATAIAGLVSIEIAPLLPPHAGAAGLLAGFLVGLSRAAVLRLPGPRMAAWLLASMLGSFVADLLGSPTFHMALFAPLFIAGQAQIEALATGVPISIWFGTPDGEDVLA